MNCVWQPPPTSLELSDQTVHVWRLRLDLVQLAPGPFRTLLDPIERARADRYRFDTDRNRFTTTRGVLRKLLGQYTGVGERELGLTSSKHGKPALDPAICNHQVEFNVSHSGALAIIGFTRRYAIGVDVEQIERKVSRERIAERFFSPDEVERLRQMPENDQREAFFRCWTRKEAFIKAHGEGLSLPLDSFSVAFGQDELPRLLRFDGDPGVDHWSLTAPEMGSGYAGAVCVASPSVTFRYYDYEGRP